MSIVECILLFSRQHPIVLAQVPKGLQVILLSSRLQLWAPAAVVESMFRLPRRQRLQEENVDDIAIQVRPTR